jgi:hypothetical protein
VALRLGDPPDFQNISPHDTTSKIHTLFAEGTGRSRPRTDDSKDESMRSRIRFAVSLAAIGLSFALVACSPGGPTPPKDGGPAAASAPAAWAECMRDNGVDIDDPSAEEFEAGTSRIPRGISPAVVEAAMETCRDLRPVTRSDAEKSVDVERLRAMARCMRDAGVDDFPDPDSEGTLRFPPAEEQETPTFKAAMEKCDTAEQRTEVG